MTDELLPPDPSVDGWYWITHSRGGIAVPFRFFHDVKNWWNYDDHGQRKASDMWQWGWRLASPHPIPGPAQLDALYALPDAIVKAEREASKDAPGDYQIIGNGAAKNAAEMLRAALRAWAADMESEE